MVRRHIIMVCRDRWHHPRGQSSQQTTERHRQKQHHIEQDMAKDNRLASARIRHPFHQRRPIDDHHHNHGGCAAQKSIHHRYLARCQRHGPRHPQGQQRRTKIGAKHQRHANHQRQDADCNHRHEHQHRCHRRMHDECQHRADKKGGNKITLKNV